MAIDPAVVDELKHALAPELQLLDHLGSGGMGDVFLARDPVLKRNVAVKVLSDRLGLSAEARRRFAQEAEAAAAVAHPNVVAVHRVGSLPNSGLGYIVMAYVEGASLAEMFPPGAVASESEARRIIGEVAAALAAAHARGVVHRDIKPGNVLHDQRSGRLVVVDFGIASVRDRSANATGATHEGLAIGTPEYMSPEQAAGDRVTNKSDVYSLGCLAYELLAGRPPISGSTPAAVFFAHMSQAPADVRTLRSDLSPDLASLVMRCLRKDPDQRPAAEEVTRALGVVRRETIEWPPPGLEVLHRGGVRWVRTVGRFGLALALFVLIAGIHPAAARPCCADAPDRSPGWLLLKRLSMVTPIRFDDPDALAIWYFLLDAVFFVLLATLLVAVVRTWSLARALMAGSRDGYPIAVLGRVAWDRHRDTGDLLNLTGRYALHDVARQRGHLARRWRAGVALTAAALLPIVTGLLWLAGGLRIRTDGSAGLLPWLELVALVAPAAAAFAVFVGYEFLDPSHRWWRRPPATRHTLRRDVLDAWLAVAASPATTGRWNATIVGLAATLVAFASILAVVAASYGLIAVFGASARFAVDRAGVVPWLASYQDPNGARVPLDERTALALVAPIPIDSRVVALLAARAVPEADARMLLESVEPAFCLNPREVLFGVSPARAVEGRRLAELVGTPSAAVGSDRTPPGERGLFALRRRARYCEQHYSDPATISPRPPVTGPP